jgi:hypothetical protein
MVRAAKLHAAMSAGIEEAADDTVIRAHQHHRFTGQGASHVIALVWQLGFMRQKQPGAPEQALLLELVEFGIHVHAARHACIALIDELAQIRVVVQSSWVTEGGSGSRHKCRP